MTPNADRPDPEQSENIHAAPQPDTSPIMVGSGYDLAALLAREKISRHFPSPETETFEEAAHDTPLPLVDLSEPDDDLDNLDDSDDAEDTSPLTIYDAPPAVVVPLAGFTSTQAEVLSRAPIVPDGGNDPEAMVAEFVARYPFPLDDFQMQAIRRLAQGESVMVAAPTGTGKTVVAEFGIFRAFKMKRRVFYTTPIKALSNQKFKDLREQYGDAVGLLTGDVIENPNGYIIVMTTEVMRNMLLQSPNEFEYTACVVFDEIHYLADSERGTTWEEAIILCPKTIQLVCLSATITNADEVARWIGQTHRPVELITHTKRAVPLSLFYFLDGALNTIIDPQGKKVADFGKIGGEAKRRVRGRFTTGDDVDDDDAGGHARQEPTQREIVEALQRDKMLPAIYFMFSRNDCEVSAELCAMMRLNMVRSPQVREQIDAIVQRYMDRLEEEDRRIEQVKKIVALSKRGLGFHHAGLLPILKQLVEELFSKGLMGVVFATDTLALGVNMPAKTVVIGRMSKWDGISRRPLIPNEFSQMAGRAGRRGLDPAGSVVIPYSPWITFEDSIAIATGALRPVESAFSVRYNSVLNLWDPPKGERVLEIMRNSLLEFQQARRLRELGGEIEAGDKKVADAKAKTGCLIGLPVPDGDALLGEYEGLGRTIQMAREDESHLESDLHRLRAKLNELPWRRPTRETLRQIFQTLPPGALVHAEEQGWGVFLGRGGTSQGFGYFLFGDTIKLLEEYRTIDYLPPERFSVTLPDLTGRVQDGQSVYTALTQPEIAALAAELGAIQLPDLTEWVTRHRNEILATVEPQIAETDARLEEARSVLRETKQTEKTHPCHTCQMRKKHRIGLRNLAEAQIELAEAHERFDERREFEENRLRQTLKSIVAVLRKFNYLDQQGSFTEKSGKLRDVFDTNSLLIVELVTRGWLDDLDAPDLAECFSWFAYDRDFEFSNGFMLPHGLIALRKKLDELEREVFSAERNNDLFISTGYNPYFYGATRAWCRGATLSTILERMQLAEGDIIITFNKTLDLLRQVHDMLIEHDPDNPLLDTLRRAKNLIRRGVVEQIYQIGFGVMQDVLQAALTTPPDAVTDGDMEAVPVAAKRRKFDEDAPEDRQQRQDFAAQRQEAANRATETLTGKTAETFVNGWDDVTESGEVSSTPGKHRGRRTPSKHGSPPVNIVQQKRPTFPTNHGNKRRKRR